MQTLSKTREEQLIAGVKTAVDLVDGDPGMTPDAALEKVARDGKWGRELVKFAACAFNTGRQTAQRENGDSILDKFAEFPLADSEKIAKSIWPDEVKTAADLQLDGISADYSRPPAWLGMEQKAASMEKAAAADSLLADLPKADPYAADPMLKASKTYNRYVEMGKEAEEARRQASSTNDNMINAMGRLGDYFKKFARDRQPFHVVEHICQAYFPKSAEALLEFAYKRNRMKEARAKDMPMPKVAVDRSQAPFNMIKECIDLGAKVVRLRTIEKEARDAQQHFKENDLNPFVRTSLRTPDLSQVPSKYLIAEDVPVEKEASGFLSSIAGSSVADRTKGLLDHALSDAPTQSARDDTLSELSDPSHDAELRKIRAQALLSKLMDDPVIGGHDQNDVLNAYNEISQLSPEGAMQPIVARSLLQRHLQGNMEPFEAKEVTDIEKGLRETDKPSNNLLQPSNGLL